MRVLKVTIPAEIVNNRDLHPREELQGWLNPWPGSLRASVSPPHGPSVHGEGGEEERKREGMKSMWGREREMSERCLLECGSE